MRLDLQSILTDPDTTTEQKERAALALSAMGYAESDSADANARLMIPVLQRLLSRELSNAERADYTKQLALREAEL
jgi:hypothetical protein